ncbi:hypothetical protein KI387_023377, partial [Taxus chinensis]
CALHCIMKMGDCKSAAVVFIVMVQLCSMEPVMACWFCPPKTKPPPSVPKLPPPSVPKLPPLPPPSVPKLPPPSVPKLPPLPPPSVPKLPPPVVTKPPCPPEVPPAAPKTPPTPITPSPEVPKTCPLDALKLGACADVLGGLVHLGIGDPSVNKCCPVLQGLLEAEAALCLCTTIKLNLLNLNIAVPLALELLEFCGFNPPPGFTCPSQR